MKKLISLTISIFMILSLCANIVFAAPSLTITNQNLDTVTGVVTISGEILGSKGKVPVTLLVEKDGAQIFADSVVSGTLTAGKTTFTINTFKFLDSAEPGVYDFYIYGRYADVSAEFEMGYVSNETWYNIIKQVNINKAAYDVAVNETAKQAALDANTAHISANAVYADLNTSVYSTFSDGAKEVISLESMKDSYPLPDIWESTTENVNNLIIQINAFKAACARGYYYATLHDTYKPGDAAGSKAAFDAWFSANKQEYQEQIVDGVPQNVVVFDLEADNGSTTLDEASFMTTVFTANYNNLNFFKRIPEIATLRDKSSLQAKIIEACILGYVDTETNGVTCASFVKNYKDHIGITVAYDSQKWGVAFGSIAGNDYPSYSALASAVNTAVNTPGQNQQNNNNNNNIFSGTTSVGGNGGAVMGVVNNGAANVAASDEAPFEDLDGYAWAKEAIDFLYARSIISGRDEKTFDPSGLVTRAEFIKMLVCTYNFENTDISDISFSDISVSDWYARYVKQAAAMGVVTGDENGCFNPAQNMTREDMAVTVFRASKFPSATRALEYADLTDISGYAVEAVASLSEKGVVAGVGDMLFAPKKTVTRAEAAKILYNVLEKTRPEEVK